VSQTPPVRGLVTPALVLLTLSGTLLAVTAAPASAGILKRLDFETGTLRQWAEKQALPHRITVQSRRVHQGRYASRFVVKPGDTPAAGGERAEVYWNGNEKAGTTSWWRWATMFPRGFHPNDGGWNFFTQWHHTGPSCSPPVKFLVEHSGNRSSIWLQIWAGRLNVSTCEPQYKREWRLSRHLRRNHWYDFVVKFRWSPLRSRGRVVVRVDGKVKVNARAANLYKGQAVYVKQGFYRGPSSKTTTIYHDGMQRFKP
jgi:Polysaccharide lyase